MAEPLHYTRRKVDVVIISDVHLGTFGCRSKALVKYLKTIQPGKLILNGDIIDIWQFRKRFFPKSHMLVIKEIMNMVARGIPVYYITGNHDELLRKFSDARLGNFHLVDKLVLQIGRQKLWIFHGDIFDRSIQGAKWLAKIGGYGYDLLILLNTLINHVTDTLGYERYSLSRKIKNSVKQAVKYISDFENVAADLAIQQQYDYVVCGHIHQPGIRTVTNRHGSVTYMNSGDWIEHMTALEYHNGKWEIFEYEERDFEHVNVYESEDTWKNVLERTNSMEKLAMMGLFSEQF